MSVKYELANDYLVVEGKKQEKYKKAENILYTKEIE